MRNLRLFSSVRKLFPIEAEVEKFFQSPDNPNELFVVGGLQIYKVDTQTCEVSAIFNVADENPIATQDDVVNILFLSIQRIICVFLKTGEIFLVNVDTLEVNISETNFLDHGVMSAKLSPDQDLIVLVTNNLRVCLLDYSLNIIMEDELCKDSFGECDFITVGWGKKETQFHGSEGKEAAKSKVQLDTGIQLAGNVNCVITWRGDGMLFAVGFLINARSMFKIFNREGVLQYTSEKQSGLECNFSWRPSGNLIASTQIFPNKYVISFFEKNGLKHGEFQLPLSHEKITIKNLNWSEDSEVLCLWYENNVTTHSHLLLYTQGNYHWYLKQSLVFPKGNRIKTLQWKENSSRKELLVFFEDRTYSQLTWIWSTDHSIGKDQNDDATVGVIDGSKLLLTYFRKSVVPPPMASRIFEFQGNLNWVVFGPSNNEVNSSINSNSFFVLCNDNMIYFHDKKGDLYASTQFCIDNLSSITNLLWLSEKCLLCIVGDIETITTIYTINILLDDSVCNTQVVQKLELKDQIIGVKIMDENNVLVQNNKGKLFNFSLNNEIKSYHVSFPECCYQFDVVNMTEGDSIVVGRSSENRFYVDGDKIANNINSYFVHSDFLLMTTLQHQLLTCPLVAKDLRSLREHDKHSSSQVLADRRVERGSRIVTVVSFDSRTVLQLPRGNIEVIQPRSLSINILGKYLDRCEYKLAFNLMRKQRINLNLLYDHNSNQFLNHIHDFVSQIDNPSWISLFLSELDAQDVRKTMYPSSYANFEGEMHENKVSMLCERFREELESNNVDNKNILPIITTYVKSNKREDLECALLRIKAIKDEEIASGSKKSICADDALKYLLCLVKVDDLYNIALGLYDFSLVMFVASKSQKDPKEYVPYLNKLKQMDPNYAKFTIDNDLKRFKSALSHLIACSDKGKEELLDFVKRHGLYNDALQNVSIDDVTYKSVAEAHGDYLMSRKCFKEAGVAFRRSSNREKALKCFSEALEWQTSLYIASELNYSNQEMNELKISMLNKLKEAKLYSEALSLLQNDDNIKESISCALEGKLYKQSLNICLKYKSLEYIDILIKPAVIEQYNCLLTLIENNLDQFNTQKKRLSIVRQNKLEKKQAAAENLAIDCDLESDTSSIMGSVNTKSSGRSYRSSKNKRKHERKMVSLKEGSKFEDQALMRALHILVTSTFDLRHDVSEIVYALLWIQHCEEAETIQNNLQVLLKSMLSGFSEIWPLEPENPNPMKNTDLPDVTIEPHMKVPPVVQEIKWKLEI